MRRLREARSDDRQWVRAQAVLGEGERLREQGGGYALDLALERYREAHRVWKTVGDRERQATALQYIAMILNRLDDRQIALRAYHEAVALYRAAGDRSGEAVTLSNIGATCHSLGEHRLAGDFHARSLALRRATGDRYGEGIVLHSLAADLNRG